MRQLSGNPPHGDPASTANARQKPNFASNSKRYDGPAHLLQNFSFVFSEPVSWSAPSRLSMRGGRVVTNARRDAVDAEGVARRAALFADGEVVWSWRPDAGAKPLDFRVATVTTKPGLTGEQLY
jgi:hypothetical protein